MQAFGLELRKANDIVNIYRDVDQVLDKLALRPNKSDGWIERQTVAHNLQKMMRVGRHFSVCDIEACAAVCHVVISAERHKIYRAVHCVDWSEMTPEYRQAIVAMVLDDFRDVLFNKEER